VNGDAERIRSIVERLDEAVVVLDSERRLVAASPRAAAALGGASPGRRIGEDAFGDGSAPLLDELRDEANRVLEGCLREDITEIKLLQEHLHDELGQLVYDRTHRRPMILPVVVEV